MGGFGELLRGCRLAAGWTQEDLAERAGVSSHAISMLESGRRGPRLSTVARLADAMGLGPDDRQRLIAAVTGDDPPERTAGPGPAGRLTPAELHADLHDFTGRAAAVERLVSLLSGAPGGPAAPVLLSAVSGTGGVGKTTLAVHVAHLVLRHFPDGQLQVDLHGADPRPADPHDLLGRFLRSLGVPPEHLPADPEERAGRWRSLLAERRMLILLDNARDAAQLRPLLPGTGASRVLVTSRSTLPGLDGAARVTLGMLDADEASTLLRRIVGAERLAAEPDAAQAVLTACAGLPLAIRLAGSRLLAHPDWSVRHLAELLRDEAGRLSVLSVEDRAVRASFAVSHRNLPPDQARAFRLLGLGPGPTISVGAAAALFGAPEAEAAALLDALVAVHLVEPAGPGRHRLHDLIRVYAAECAAERPPAEREAAVERLLRWFLHSNASASRRLRPERRHLDLAPPAPPLRPLEFTEFDAALAWSEQEGDCLVAAVAAAAESGRDELGWQLAHTMWDLFDLRAAQPGRIGTYRHALAGARRLADPKAEAWALNALAVAYQAARRLAEAEECLLDALAIRRRLGDLHGEASVLGNLGYVRIDRGRPAEAVALLERTTDIFRGLGQLRAEAASLENLGEAYKLMGRFEAALDHYQQALVLFEKSGAERFRLGRSLSNVAETLHLLGRHEEAVVPATEAYAANREAGNRIDEAIALEVLGHSHAVRGDREAAREVWERALLILLDLGHPRAADVQALLKS
ncbi:tetratricopeptide repeat protein [Kitasatospora sp. NPDC049285]|uniref:ATP-binding protein n=1 Tax=Kitasatospora sp. NPDC049285 TaxID=3157096 RepID=UPI0034386D4D